MDYSKKVSKYADTKVILTKKQEKELKKLVKYVKKNSPRMAELYEEIGDDFTLQDLPVTNKKIIMEDYDNWITASDFTIQELEEFTADEKKAGELFKGKYFVCETSGTTGDPFYMVYNRAESRAMANTINADLRKKVITHRPSFFLYPARRHLISTCTVKQSHKKYPLFKNNLIFQDSNAPTKEIVEKLNQIQPKMLFSYASTAEFLASEQVKGNLHLDLAEIAVGGETLSSQSRDYIQKAFRCKVRSVYACTETSGISVDCEYDHMHLHNEGMIIEPVDENNHPVPVGQKAHKILITALCERTVPLIRYEITDKVTIHNTPCKCGNKAPWVEVDGRTMVLPFIFKNESGEVTVSTVVLILLAESLSFVRRIQIVLRGYDQMECRVDFMEGVDEQECFKEIKQVFAAYLAKNEVDHVNIYLSDEKPQIDAGTCKFIEAYQIFTN